MQGNYPSIAKACTFASRKGRPNRFDASEQKANQTPEISGRFMGLAVGVAAGAVFLPGLPGYLPEIWPLVCTGRRVDDRGAVCMNGASVGTERRKWARLPLAIPVFVRSRDGKGKELLEFATALNVSAGGMLVAIRRILPAIAQIRLEIPSAPVAALALLPKASRALRAKALRTTPAEGYYLLGLKFLRPLPVSGNPNGRRRRKIASAV